MGRTNRVILGLFLGGGMGLAYGLTSHAINPLALWDIPLYDPAPGWVVRIVLSAVAGAGVAVVASLPQEGLVGVGLGSLGGALGVSFQGIWQAAENGNLLAALLVLIYTFIPRLFYFMPLAASVRLAMAAWQDRDEADGRHARRMARLLAALLLVSMLVGSLSLYPAPVRTAMRSLDRMLTMGLEARSRTAVPDALRAVEGFPYRARGAYTLEWSDPTGSIDGPRPVPHEAFFDVLIVVRFANGFLLQCRFIHPEARPLCTGNPLLGLPILRQQEVFHLAGGSTPPQRSGEPRPA